LVNIGRYKTAKGVKGCKRERESNNSMINEKSKKPMKDFAVKKVKRQKNAACIRSKVPKADGEEGKAWLQLRPRT